MYWIRDNLDSTAFSLAGGQILLSFPVTELMSKVRSNCLTEASTFLYQYVGCWYWGMCFYQQMPLSLKNIHKAANKPTPVENPEQRWSDAWPVPVLMVSSQRQQIQWLKPTNWAEHLISHWFTAWPSPHPFQQIMQSLPLFFYHMVRKILFRCFSNPHKLWEPINICEMLWIHCLSRTKGDNGNYSQFSFSSTFKTISVPQMKWSHPNLVSLKPLLAIGKHYSANV